MAKHKKPKPVINYQQLPLEEKTKVQFGIWGGDVPKNSPQWVLDLLIDKSKFAWMIEISGIQVLELINLGIEVKITHGSESGYLMIWIDEVGKGFSVR